MREINVSEITLAVSRLCTDANYHLGEDILKAYDNFSLREASPLGQEILGNLKQNACLAAEKEMPVCQDTGMAILFVKVGQEVHFTGGSLEDALNEGVRQGYTKGFLRASVVEDPLRRVNTKDNTPAVIYYEIIPGDRVEITLAPKGFGSENMSGVRMLKPSEGVEGVKKFVLEVVENAGGNPCPPMVVGVGIGGSMDKAALLAKKALLRPIGSTHQDPYYQALEEELSEKVNRTGIGPQGLGGTTTAFGVFIETYPTHIAGLPVAVNISCHVTRHKSVTI